MWQKLYKWKIYNVKTVNVYKYKLVRRASADITYATTWIYGDVKIDENTGKITLINLLNSEKNYKSVYVEYKNEIYEGTYENSYFKGYTVYRAEKYIAESYKEKSSYIKEIYSNQISDYPKNGEKDGYWYELVEE